MSFDLHLFELEHGPNEVERAGETLARLDAAFNNRSPLDPKAEEQKLHLASLLLEANPALSVSEKDYVALAEFEGSTEEQARLRWRHIELNGPPQEKLAQIILHDCHVTIHWYSGTSDDEMTEYLRVICEATGFAVYDPQGSRVFRPA